jgi:hypothetical protein
MLAADCQGEATVDSLAEQLKAFAAERGLSIAADRHVYASRTRFIPEKLLGLFERTSWPSVSPGAAARNPAKVRESTSERACAQPRPLVHSNDPGRYAMGVQFESLGSNVSAKRSNGSAPDL